VAAADYINRNRLGTTFQSKGETLATLANASVGPITLLSSSTVRGNETGTVQTPETTTQLAESTYGHSVNGVLPRVFVGEERDVSLRAGSVKVGTGEEQLAIAVKLESRDERMHGAEVQHLERFSKALGLPLEGLPAVKPEQVDQDLGQGRYAVELALTNAQVKKLASWSPDDVSLAFASAQKEIDGSTVMPPWYSDRAKFDHFARQLRALKGTRSGNADEELKKEYRRVFPGRNLGVDLQSERALEGLLTETANLRGKPVNEWGPLLESIGSQQSTDMRASILALRRLTGASVVMLDAEVAGQNASVRGESTSAASLDEQVGQLMSTQ
jgi:hypothetical protein